MSDIIVHSIPGSPFGRAVLTTLIEKGARFRLDPVAPGAHRAEPHISRHPFARVPVIEHQGFMLYETQAILRYLDRTFPRPALTPADPKAAARMDQAMNINDWYLFQGVNNAIGFQRVIGPRVLGLTPDEAVIAAAMPKAHTVFNEFSRLLGGKDYLVCDTLTLADLMVAPHLDILAGTPEWGVLTAPAPNLVSWLERMRERPSFAATTWERVAAMAAAQAA